MRVVAQRVKECSVTVGNETTGEIGPGLLIYLGVTDSDNQKDLDYLVRKIANLRIFEDDSGAMNLSALDLGYEICIVSQFTLYGNVRKGRRPSFTEAAAPDKAEQLYDECVDAFRRLGLSTASGKFGAHMLVSYTNDGPVTFFIDSAQK